jgi:antitoxin (DNA-binding transcriptional repressor) of toxin-antitoxin stability system
VKIIGVREARNSFSRTIDLSRNERVVIASHGRPVALMIGLEGYDMEDILLASDPQFWTMIQNARKQPTVSEAEARRRLGVPIGNPTERRRSRRAPSRSR